MIDNYINNYQKINLTLPSWSIKSYGGSSFACNNNLLVSTRNSQNKSRISLYRLEKNSDNSLFYTTPLRSSLLDNHKDYYRNSLGQSYPFFVKINSINILFFTDWYYDQSQQRILNRLIIGNFNEQFYLERIHIFKTGLLSKSGAIRAYVIEDNLIIFLPIFQNFEHNFPDYVIHKFKFKLDQNETFESLIKKFSSIKGTPLITGFSKTTCFNIVQYLNKKTDSYDVIFSGRNNNQKYNIYLGNINKNFNFVSNIRKLDFDQSLSYPSLYFDGNDLFLISSLGRYGDQGLIISIIK